MTEEFKNRKTPPDESLTEKFENPGRTEIEDEKRTSKEEKEEKRDEERKDKFQALLIKYLPCIFRTSLIIIGVIIVIRALHLVLPAYLCWMDESQLDFVDKVLAFIFGIVITKYFPKIFPEKSSLKQ